MFQISSHIQNFVPPQRPQNPGERVKKKTDAGGWVTGLRAPSCPARPSPTAIASSRWSPPACTSSLPRGPSSPSPVAASTAARRSTRTPGRAGPRASQRQGGGAVREAVHTSGDLLCCRGGGLIYRRPSRKWQKKIAKKITPGVCTFSADKNFTSSGGFYSFSNVGRYFESLPKKVQRT